MFIHCPPIELKTYERVQINGKRHYRTPLGDYPSITSVLSVLDGDWLAEWIERVGEKEANRISSTSTGRGTNLHLMCEDYLNNVPLSCKMPDALEMFHSIKHILNKINNIHFQEACLFSDKLKVAGTVDCIGEYDGILSVIDFKTSRRIKTEDKVFNYFLQETFYALAYFELTGITISQIVTIMAVEDEQPMVFIKPIRPYIKPLIETVNLFNLEFTKSA
jgi:genome maintenance exonuclease 1